MPHTPPDVQSHIDALDARRKGRDTPLSESARLRVELRRLGLERDRLAARIEGLCDGGADDGGTD